MVKVKAKFRLKANKFYDLLKIIYLKNFKVLKL